MAKVVGAGSLVVIVRVLDPAWVCAAARGVRVRAVDSIAAPGIDVELYVDDQPVAFVQRDERGEARVVVDLEQFTRRRADVKGLVVAGLRGVIGGGPVECDLGAHSIVGDGLMQRLVVPRLAASARDHQDRDREARDRFQAESACSSVILPSYSAFPTMTASAPDADTWRMSSTVATPP